MSKLVYIRTMQAPTQEDILRLAQALRMDSFIGEFYSEDEYSQIIDKLSGVSFGENRATFTTLSDKLRASLEAPKNS